MSPPSRRALLTATAGLAAVSALPSPAAATSGPDRVRLAREERRAVVIGSGFGGGVAALRLAQAGVPVTVLERGRRWPTGPNAETFPRVSGLDRRALWYGTLPAAVRPLAQLIGTPLNLGPHVGLLEPVPGRNILGVCAAGFGGDSLVYQGMTLQPSEAVFNTWLPRELDYRRMNEVHYPQVAAMLRAATAPDELVSSSKYSAARVFAERVRRAGYGLEKIAMPIDWEYALAELHGERMKPSYTNGDCAFGVSNGGKHSVDVTYLSQAESTGKVTVETHYNVTSVARAADGRREVHVDRTEDTGRVLERKVLFTRALVMAADSKNTSKLLVRAEPIPDLPGVSAKGGRVTTEAASTPGPTSRRTSERSRAARSSAAARRGTTPTQRTPSSMSRSPTRTQLLDGHPGRLRGGRRPRPVLLQHRYRLRIAALAPGWRCREPPQHPAAR
ncbi:GMC family oxidoreductase N-terminal domain-containing protein [Streptomyces microflavus]|uniref:GMC family oxidoreductase N-terminal domain-containing protein n=1 Tax=Streptomyces microflavus TaxID=1919 RepID=UPI0033BB6192